MSKNIQVLQLPLLIGIFFILILLLRLFPLGGVWTSLDFSTWVIFIFFASIYFIWIYLGIRCTKINGYFIECIDAITLNKVIRCLCIFSIIGASLIIYDFSILRGYGFHTAVADVRLQEVKAATNGFSGSWISGSGRFLTPALLSAYTLVILVWHKVARNTFIVLLISSFCVMTEQAMFEGGRFYLASFFFIIIISKFFNKKLKKMLLKQIVLFVGLCLFFAYIFITRYSQNPLDSYMDWVAMFDLNVKKGLQIEAINHSLVAVNMLWIYATQGLNELDSLCRLGHDSNAFGSVQFPQINILLNKIQLIDFKYKYPRMGTYSTLYGASIIDFGYFGAFLFISVIGFFTGKSIKLINSQIFNYYSLCAPVLITIGLFSPIVSLVPNLWPVLCWSFCASFITLNGHYEK